MPFVQFPDTLYSMTARMRFGRPTLFGYIMFGWTQFGEDNAMCGIYQGRRRRKGTWHWYEKITTRQDNFLMRHYWPENPQTEDQQNWRGQFANAVLAFQNLTDEQKQEIIRLAKGRNRRPYNYFISNYLKSL